jgi:hypothetical protein
MKYVSVRKLKKKCLEAITDVTISKKKKKF